MIGKHSFLKASKGGNTHVLTKYIYGNSIHLFLLLTSQMHMERC